MTRPGLSDLREALGRTADGLGDQELAAYLATLEWIAELAIEEATRAAHERRHQLTQRPTLTLARSA